MLERFIAISVLFLSVFLMPFWGTVVLGVFFCFYFDNFLEIMPIFLIIDIVFATKINYFLNFESISFFVSVFIFVFTFIIKRQIRIN